MDKNKVNLALEVLKKRRETVAFECEETSKELERLESELKGLDSAIKAFEPKSGELKFESRIKTSNDLEIGHASLFGDKDISNLSVNQLFLMTLKECKRFMKVREIAKFIIEQNGGNEDEWVKKLSRRTNKLKELNKIAGKKVGTAKSAFVWGSPKWLDENGGIKPEFMYDEDALKGSRKSAIKDFEI